MMESMAIFPLLFALAFGGFGGGDLLDLMTCDGYWKAKQVTVTPEQLAADAKAPPAPADIGPLVKDLGSEQFKVRQEAREKIEAMGPAVLEQVLPLAKAKDQEVAAIAQELIETFTKHAREREVRRLMAIRTLGEKKEKSGLPVLRDALTSKDLFVADYASKAIALIEGTPVPARVRADTSKDAWRLPADLCAVIHVGGAGSGEFPTIEKLVTQMPMEFGPAAEGGPDPRKMMVDEAYKSMLGVIERIGNARVDGLTVGVAADIGDAHDNAPPAKEDAPAAPPEDSGFVALIARGTFDHAAVVAALAEAAHDQVKITLDGDAHVLTAEGHAMGRLIGNNLAAVVVGPDDKHMKAPAALLKASLAAEGAKGTLADGPLAADAKTLDMKGPVWGLLKPTASMKKNAAFLACYDRITLSTARTEKEIAFTITAEGTDAEAIKASVENVKAQLKTAAESVKPMIEQMPAMKVYADVIESIQIEATPTKAMLKGKLPADMGVFFSGAMMGISLPAPGAAEAPRPLRRKAA